MTISSSSSTKNIIDRNGHVFINERHVDFSKYIIDPSRGPIKASNGLNYYCVLRKIIKVDIGCEHNTFGRGGLVEVGHKGKRGIADVRLWHVRCRMCYNPITQNTRHHYYVGESCPYYNDDDQLSAHHRHWDKKTKYRQKKYNIHQPRPGF